MNTRKNMLPSPYLAVTSSDTYKAFMEGARCMLRAIQLLPDQERNLAFSAGNDQHILGLLVYGSELIEERRRQDARRVLGLYGYDKYKLAAFLLDVPRLNGNTYPCYPCLQDGTPLEDEHHQPLPEVTNPGWPRGFIEHILDGHRISHEEYRKLSLAEREDYACVRIFPLGRDHKGGLAHGIRSNDTIMMEELIRDLILIGDSDINDRLLKAATPSPDEEEEHSIDLLIYPLYHYRDAVVNALNELRSQEDYDPLRV